ncbi:MAG: class II glutamine amidotransferase [Burkholderiales bacterium]
MSSQHPIGETDSEHAFCALLERLRQPWKTGAPPTVEERHSLLTAFASDLRALGPANFIYADGDAVFAHGDRRMQRTSKRAEPPGLWTRQRHCAPADPAPDDNGGVSIAQEAQSVVWIASVPLTDEIWRPLAEGEILAVRSGELVGS